MADSTPSSAALAPHLPGLRRFARLLTGSQAGGDACVAAALEAMAAPPGLRPPCSGARTELYRNVLDVYKARSPDAGDEPEFAPRSVPGGEGRWNEGAAAAERRLATLTPDARVAFLLIAVEEFTVEEAAEVLGVSAAGAAQLVDRAGREIARMMATSIVIIEDEPLIAMDLERAVEDLGHRVDHVARTRRQAVAVVQAHRPGLVLADIELADGSSGLEAVNDIIATFEVPVVFVTAYPERLLTGSRPEPAFLIAKPFQPDALKAVVSQALFFGAKARLRPRRAASA